VLQELRSALRAARPTIRQRGGAEDPIRDVEVRLVSLLLGSDEGRRHARNVVEAGDLEHTRVAAIVRAILDVDAGGLPVDGPLVVDALSEETDRELLTRIAFRNEAPGGADEVDGCLEMLKHVRWKKESRDVARAAEAVDRDEQTERLRRLMDLGRRMDAPHRRPTLE
jgi:hypothetical protein